MKFLGVQPDTLDERVAAGVARRVLENDMAPQLALALANDYEARIAGEIRTDSREGLQVALDLASREEGQQLAQRLIDSPEGFFLLRELAASSIGRRLALTLGASPHVRHVAARIVNRSPSRRLAQSIAGSPAGAALARVLLDSDAAWQSLVHLTHADDGPTTASWLVAVEGVGIGLALGATDEGRALALSLAATESGHHLLQRLAVDEAGLEVALQLAPTDEAHVLAHQFAASIEGLAAAASLARTPAGRRVAEELNIRASIGRLANNLPAERYGDDGIVAAALALLAGAAVYGHIVYGGLATAATMITVAASMDSVAGLPRQTVIDLADG